MAEMTPDYFTPNQANVLSILDAAGGPMAVEKIAELDGRRRQGVLTTLRSLERDKLIVHGGASGPNEVPPATITAEGRRMFDEHSACVEAHQARKARQN